MDYPPIGTGNSLLQKDFSKTVCKIAEIMAIYILFSLRSMFSSIDYDEIKLYMII